MIALVVVVVIVALLGCCAAPFALSLAGMGSTAVYNDGIAVIHVDGIILGCTEIPMVLTADDCPVPLVDTARCHAEAIFSAAWGPTAAKSVDNAVALEAVAEMALGVAQLVEDVPPLESVHKRRRSRQPKPSHY